MNLQIFICGLAFFVLYCLLLSSQNETAYTAFYLAGY
jgi:hypothetical protein